MKSPSEKTFDPRSAHGRILMVTSSFPRWVGDATAPFVLHLARDVRDLGWDVHVLAPHAPGAARIEEIDGIQVERFRYLWPERLQTVCYNGGALGNLRRNRSNVVKLPMLVLSEWAATRRKLKTKHFDVLHSHWILPQGLVCSLAARSLGVPHVATVHGSDVLALRNAGLDYFRRRALAGADCITVNSSVTHAAVTSLAHESRNVVRIPMGATASAPRAERVAQIRETYREMDGPLLIFVGRLTEEKGIGDAITAMPTILRSRPRARLLIIGDGPDRPMFEAAARECGVATRVTFRGWIDAHDLVDFYAAADIFVGPSKRAVNGGVEAQGLTFAEALLAGVPIVATASGGIVDVIRDGETGLLVPEGSPEQIADAVLRLCADAGLAGRLAANGVEFARRNLTRETSARAFSRVYARLRAAPSI